MTHTMQPDEGYIKFECRWTKHALDIAPRYLNRLNTLRHELTTRNWVGTTPEGIGFGNISIRHPTGKGFLITGTATGGINQLTADHYAWVTASSPRDNTVDSIGMVRASSESMTHAAIYNTLAQVQCVIHIHAPSLWSTLLHRIPTTHPACAFGTPDLAEAIAHLARHALNTAGIIALAGHQDGLMAFGIGETNTLAQLKNTVQLANQTACTNNKTSLPWRFWNAGRWPLPTYNTTQEPTTCTPKP